MTVVLWRKRRALFLVLVLVQTISKLSFQDGPLHQSFHSDSFQRVTTGVTALENNSNSHSATHPQRPLGRQGRVFYSCTLPVNATIGNETLQEERMVTLPQVPDFIIIGAQKAGTTAIRSLLSLHPRFRNSTIKEPHFFDMHNSSLKLDIRSISKSSFPSSSSSAAERAAMVERLVDPLLLCEARHAYAQSFELDYIYASNNSSSSSYSSSEQRRIIYYEKTPAYIITDGAAAKIRAVTPWAKIVVSLRNPIDRCFSQYQMEVERSGDQYSFEHWLARDLAVLRSTNISSIVSFLPRSNEHLPSISQVTTDYGYFRPPHVDDTGEWKSANCIYRGMYAHQLQEQWLSHFTLNKDLLVVEFGRLKRNPRELLKQILDFVYTSSNGNDNVNGNDSSDDQNSNINNPQSNFYQEEHFNTSYSPNPGESGLVMSNVTRAYLQRLYKPFNDQLADILGDEWRGIWD
jgi:Sulfotransferase domain